MEQVRHPQQEIVELPFYLVRPGQLLFRSVGHLTQPHLQRVVARLRKVLGQLVLLGLDRLCLVQVTAPSLVQLQDLSDWRRLTLQVGRPLHTLRVAPDELEWKHYDSAFMTGKRITSRTEGWSVSSITSRSIPTPSPPHGGRPYSTARRKSSSIG